MAIFKHIRKSARRQRREGCSSHWKIVWKISQNNPPVGVTDEVVAPTRSNLRYKAYYFVMSFPVSERAKWEKHLDAVVEDLRKRTNRHGNI